MKTKLRKYLLPLLLCLLLAVALGFFFRPVSLGEVLQDRYGLDAGEVHEVSLSIMAVYWERHYALDEPGEIASFMEEISSWKLRRCPFPHRSTVGFELGSDYRIYLLGPWPSLTIATRTNGRDTLCQINGSCYYLLNPVELLKYQLDSNRVDGLWGAPYGDQFMR